jgi:hypothetical protein
MRNPWMTREIIRLLRQKRRRWKAVRTSGSDKAWGRYKDAEKNCANKIRNAKRKMERDLASNPDKNNRKFARYIKSKTKSRTTIGPILTEEGTLLTSDVEMAEELNKFFVSVFTQENMESVPEAKREVIQQQMKMTQVTEKQIRDKIRNLRVESASGPDGLSPRILKELVDVVVKPLRIIFNKSLEEAAVPDDWKTANVTPIHKKGPKNCTGNYRPVSLTSVLCKLLKSILKDNIMEHLLVNKLIRPSQHGFMPGKPCASNLAVFLDKVTKAVDDGKSVNIFYLDFAKAFDKVPRQQLPKKPEAKGVDTVVVKWIEAWLIDRKQRMVINGTSSEESEVESGVPQGSVLGPCLFTTFIDDLEVEVEQEALNTFLIKFADDTKGMQEIMSDEDRAKMQKALDLLSKWASDWGMMFNVDKCKA